MKHSKQLLTRSLRNNYSLRETLALLPQKRLLFLSILFAIGFVYIQVYTLNYRLINLTLLGAFPLSYKVTLLWHLFIGYWAMFPLKDIIFTTITALLVGLNFSLLLVTFRTMARYGSLKFSFGGTSLFALISTGCPSCGLTVLSFLGPSASFFTLFLHNTLIQVTILVILGASVYSHLKSFSTSVSCVLPQKH